MLFYRLDLIADPAPHPAALNMAIDEVILKRITRPALRVYRWAEPSVSFGYFECWETTVALSASRPAVRRWTGGGIVEHGADTTYSLFVPPSESGFLTLGTAGSYETIHAALAAAMREIGVDAKVASEAAPAVSRACFENPVRHDVLAAGRKIAGAAQRRTRWGLLHQGSIGRTLPADFGHRFARELAAEVSPVSIEEIAEGIVAEASRLAATRYSTDAWNRRR